MASEELLRDAYRDKIMMIDQYTKGAVKHGNYTTLHAGTDSQIEKHKKLAKIIFEMHEDGKSYASIGKALDLTANQVKTIASTWLMILRAKAQGPLLPPIPVKSKEEIYAEAKKQIVKKKPTYSELELLNEGEETFEFN